MATTHKHLKTLGKYLLVIVLAIAATVAYGRFVLDEKDSIRYCENRVVEVQNFPLSHLSDWEIEMCIELKVSIPGGG